MHLKLYRGGIPSHPPRPSIVTRHVGSDVLPVHLASTHSTASSLAPSSAYCPLYATGSAEKCSFGACTEPGPVSFHP